MPTFKQLAVPIRFPLDRVNMSTPGTDLAGIGGWAQKQLGHQQCWLCILQTTQLVKRPIMVCVAQFCYVAFDSRLSNVSQVFKSQCSVNLFCLLNKLLRNVVIQPLLKPVFSPGKPSQKPTRIPSAFGLNIGSDLTISVTSSLNRLPLQDLPVEVVAMSRLPKSTPITARLTLAAEALGVFHWLLWAGQHRY
jgi:hypothetical protein